MKFLRKASWTLLLLAAVSTMSPAGPQDAPAKPTPETVELAEFTKLWNYGDPAASERAFRVVLARAEAAGEADLALEIKTQLARTHSLRRAFPAAHALLDEVEPKLEGASRRVRVRYLLERGRTHNSAGEKAPAEKLFSAAWDLAREKGAAAEGLDPLAVDAAHMLAIVAQGEAALAWNEKALAFAEASQDPRAKRWLGSLYNNIGWTYHELGRHEEALALFQKALAWHEAHGNPRSLRIAKWSVARGLRALGRLDEALAIQRKLEAELAEAKESDGYVLEELAELLLAKGEEAAAKPYFAQAYAALAEDAWFAKHEAERLARLARLGGVETPAQTPAKGD